MQWTFIGAGNMASSLIGGLTASGVNGSSVTVVDVNSDACDRLVEKFGVTALNSADKLETGQAVVVAVKPNVVETVCTALASKQPSLLVSVAAGVRISAMDTWLGGNSAIVRCMPNTPALLGCGATALFANKQCNEQQKQQSQQLLSTAGTTCWVDKEDDLDAVTAVSGSGPAYFFYLIEHMISAATDLGLSEQMARDLAIETAYGAANMARLKESTPDVLRQNVTSKGGTTAAALAVFDEQQTAKTIAKAMQAARDRAIELGDEFGASS